MFGKIEDTHRLHAKRRPRIGQRTSFCMFYAYRFFFSVRVYCLGFIFSLECETKLDCPNCRRRYYGSLGYVDTYWWMDGDDFVTLYANAMRITVSVLWHMLPVAHLKLKTRSLWSDRLHPLDGVIFIVTCICIVKYVFTSKCVRRVYGAQSAALAATGHARIKTQTTVG